MAIRRSSVAVAEETHVAKDIADGGLYAKLDSIFGVSLVVILANSEQLSDENSKKLYDNSQLEFLQYHLRSVCLDCRSLIHRHLCCFSNSAISFSVSVSNRCLPS